MKKDLNTMGADTSAGAKDQISQADYAYLKALLTVKIDGAMEGDVLTIVGGNLVWRSKYNLCEFYYFRHPTLKPGFLPAQGDIIENAATLYPEAWAYLQSTEGQLLCKSEEEWQSLTQAIWHTNADGTMIGWEGIGGAPFYAPDTATGALRLPDLRGMYIEAAGFDGLDVGGTHGDGMRNVTGEVSSTSGTGFYKGGIMKGAFTEGSSFPNFFNQITGIQSWSISFDASLTTPVANKVQPRAWGALACVFLGRPST